MYKQLTVDNYIDVIVTWQELELDNPKDNHQHSTSFHRGVNPVLAQSLWSLFIYPISFPCNIMVEDRIFIPMSPFCLELAQVSAIGFAPTAARKASLFNCRSRPSHGLSMSSDRNFWINLALTHITSTFTIYGIHVSCCCTIWISLLKFIQHGMLYIIL